ncbi:MAG TPA: hypothetical protein VF559_09800 [Caulobacteraceae bacterium]|jgi:hypothetical protein
MKRLTLAVLAAAALGGGLTSCATPTAYAPAMPEARRSYGFREVQLDTGHWRVTFAGNSLTSRETVERYLLYRAAELTAAQGFDWFETTDRNTERKSRYYADPDPYYGSGFGLGYGWGWRPHWAYYGGFGWRTWDPWFGGPFGGGLDIHEVTRYEASAEIAMGRGAPPDGRRVLNAREVLANLGPTIVRPEPRG